MNTRLTGVWKLTGISRLTGISKLTDISRLTAVLLLAATLAVSGGCGVFGPDPSDDDTVSDDDGSAGDDDTALEDDDATLGDDDTSLGDDDTSAGDDDTTSGDDDASAGDDDVTSGDDDTSPGDDDVTSGDDDTTPGIECGEEQVGVDGVCAADIPEGWTQVFPGGDTICARETEYSFWVRKGTVNKLAVGFDGGGACWDAWSCSTTTPIFSPEIDEDDDPNNLTDGLMDFENPENPFRDWYVVFIPYCTGDVHWGDAVVTYPATENYPEVTIQHKGFVNGSAVMSWIYDHFAAPETVLVTGVSAGSYGSLMFAPYLMEHFPASRVVQFGDCGAGVITQEFLVEAFIQWDALKNVPDYLTEIHEEPLETLTLSDVYVAASNYYPYQVYSQYNTAYDENQEFYYWAMGGAEEDWHDLMEANIQAIVDNAPSFRYYTAWGELHGILPFPEFYTYQVDGVRIRDWLTDLVEGEDVANVHCTDCWTEEYYEP